MTIWVIPLVLVLLGAQQVPNPQSVSKKTERQGKQSSTPSTANSVVVYQTSEPLSGTEQSDSGEAANLSKRLFDALVANWPLVIVGIGGVFAALKTLRAIQRQIEIQISGERAWVLVDPGIIPDDFEPNPNRVAFLEVRPIIKNYGKTPAQITRVGISEEKVPAAGALQPEPKYKYEQSVDIVLPPDQPIQPLRIMIAQTDFIDVRQGDPVLYVHGFVDYLDLGGQERKTRFCFVYNVPSGFTSSNRGFYISGNAPAAYTKCT